MSDHLVQQSVSSTAVTLTCMDCDWFAKVGRRHILDYETLVTITPVVQLAKWSHTDPGGFALAFSAGEVTERSTWRRVREYLTKGVAP